MSQNLIPNLPAPLATAQDECRLTTASILDLHSPDGASIAIHSQPVLMVGATPPPGPLRKMTEFFEGGEHTFLGDKILLNFEGQSKPTPAASYSIQLPNQLKLRYGQILALAGDFYGFPDRAISADPSGQTFQDAFDSLARLSQSNAEATQILQSMKTEIDAANRAVADGADASTAYDALGDQLNHIYNHETGGGYSFIPRGRYLLLAATNWDHFGATAVTAYSIGHTRAQLAATAAAKLTTPAARRAALELAYAMNAFADHFLTDLFSSGHLRTPRKEMHDVLLEATGSLCARMMHDEDSCYGLQVTNAKGETWTAYGDKRLRDRVNAENLKRAEAAVQMSADEVWHAFQGTAPANGALQLIPDFAALLANPSNPANRSPLFIVQNGRIAKREHMSDLKNYSWTTAWATPTTYMTRNWFSNMAACGDREKLMMDWATLSISYDRTAPSLILYDHKAANTIGPVGVTSVPGFELDDFTHIGDVNRDGVPEFINVKSDYSSIQVFGLSETGAYTLIDSLQSPPAVSSVATLTVDATGEGDVRLVCTPIDETSGNIGLKTYRIENGKIVVTQNTTDIGVGPYSPVPILFDPPIVAVDMNGDGKQQLAFFSSSSNPCDSRTTTQSLYILSADSTGQFSLSWKGNIPITPLTPNSIVAPDQESFAWVLPVDANGDGKTELAQMFVYHPNSKPDQFALGLHLYGPDGAGGYKEISTNFDLGAGGPRGGPFVADYDGDGCDEIIMLADAKLSPNVTIRILKYQKSPKIHATDSYYQLFAINTQLGPNVDKYRNSMVVNKHKKGSNDHIVVFFNNAGQLTMRVIGGGRALRILKDYALEPDRGHFATFYPVELNAGDVD